MQKDIFSLGISPSPDLVAYVHCYDIIEMLDTREIPTALVTAHSLFFHYGNLPFIQFRDRLMEIQRISVNGLVNQPALAQNPKKSKLLAVKIEPWALHHFIRQDIEALTNFSTEVGCFSIKPNPAWVVDALAECKGGRTRKGHDC